jgi:hypothetical protein
MHEGRRQSMTPIVDLYFGEAGKPVLRRSVVVVADILGFCERTKQAFAGGAQQSLLETLHRILSREYSFLDDPSQTKWRLKVYSDNLILGYPFLADKSGVFEFEQACFSIAHYQLGMASEGYFIRGGIGVGEVHISDRIVYGDVLNEVKRADKHGTPPRVVLLDSAIKHSAAIDAPSHLDRIICKGEKGPFINYLGILDLVDNDLRRNSVLAHKVAIEGGLSRHPGEADRRCVLEKYEWLARYHNTFCSHSRHFSRPEFLVNV